MIQMLGMGQWAHHPCEFGDFFACSRGSTPQELLLARIYDQIAIPLRGGAWRATSMVMLANSLAASTATKVSAFVTSDEVASAEKTTGTSRLKQSKLPTRLSGRISIRTRMTSASVRYIVAPPEPPPAG